MNVTQKIDRGMERSRETERGRIREMKNETYCEKYVQWEWEKRSEKS